MLSFKLPLRFLQGIAIVQILVAALVIGAAVFGAFAPAGASISGVCPDGSIFIVQTRAAIPCNEAKQVDPQDIPPLNPQLLPKPYGWGKFHSRQDPNNPYNVVDAAPTLYRADAPPRRFEESEGVLAPEAGLAREELPSTDTPEQTSLAPSPRMAGERASPRAPGFSVRELRDLTLIVEIAQQRAPATFPAESDTGAPDMTVRLAHSEAFAPRLRAHWEMQGARSAGQAVLFTVTAASRQSFYGNLTFVQGTIAFHPDRDDPSELGILQGALGDLPADDVVLGYAWLPEGIDLRQEIDIYWNDRVLTATLDPS